jgi:excisionase family DNA binding protein
MAEELLTTVEAARMLRVGVSTLTRWVRLGQMRAVRLPSGHYRIPREEVEKLLREAQEEGDSG